ncbi:hypothetical protein CALCODRAFT_110399 [Calocera cornea HHB12733]|uniref:Uncharacterized protein n=1 Tax=Calocera cornea HHB12733 TaxID=1353952 RepID=A0A165D255_9BASI|nr:hypothetical protein CALCODRAFT_110399 [Calocera cornea HHB12733]
MGGSLISAKYQFIGIFLPMVCPTITFVVHRQSDTLACRITHSEQRLIGIYLSPVPQRVGVVIMRGSHEKFSH